MVLSANFFMLMKKYLSNSALALRSPPSKGFNAPSFCKAYNSSKSKIPF